MRTVRQDIGGLGNLLFKNAYLWAQMRDGKIPDVYVQSEEYFRKYRDEIRMLYGNGIKPINKVAFHIRRGDYLKANQFHVNLWDTDYYKEAVKLFPNEKFIVFCRDRQNEELDAADKLWCVDNLDALLGPKNEAWTFAPRDQEETDDLNLMASCKGIIGANSSFSWWGAYLGDPNKKIVMPREDRWFSDKVERTVLLDEWTKI